MSKAKGWGWESGGNAGVRGVAEGERRKAQPEMWQGDVSQMLRGEFQGRKGLKVDGKYLKGKNRAY